MGNPRFFYYALAFIATAGFCAGCGGGGGSTALPAGPGHIVGTSGPGPQGPLASANVSVKMPVYATPKPQSKGRKQQTWRKKEQASPPSLQFTVNGTVASTVNLTNGTGLYFITIPLSVGADHIVADLYDASNGTGTKIATGTTDATITVGGTNSVTIVLNPIVGAVCLTPTGYALDTGSPPILAGTTGSIPFYLGAVDPDGNPISSTAIPTVTFSASGPASSGVSIAPASANSLGTTLTVSWTSAAAGNAALASSMPCQVASALHFAGPYFYVTEQSGHIDIFDQNKNPGDVSGVNSGEGSIWQITDALNTPISIVFDSQTTPKKFFVADYGDNTVFEYNAETNQYIASFGQVGHPWGLSLSHDGTRLFVSVTGPTDQVSIFDANQNANIPALTNVGPSPIMALGSYLNGLTTYWNGTQDTTVVAARYPQQAAGYAPSLATITGTAPAGYDPFPIPTPGPLAAPAFATAQAATSNTLLVRENGGAAVQYIDLSTGALGAGGGLISGTTPFPDQYVPGPNAIAVKGNTALAVGGTNSLFVMNWNTGWQYNTCLSVGSGGCGTGDTHDPVGVAFSNDHQFTTYVVNYGNASVSVFDSSCGGPSSLRYEVAAGARPLGIAIGDGGLPPPAGHGC